MRRRRRTANTIDSLIDQVFKHADMMSWTESDEPEIEAYAREVLSGLNSAQLINLMKSIDTGILADILPDELFYDLDVVTIKDAVLAIVAYYISSEVHVYLM